MERVREDVGAGVDLGDPRVRAGDVPGAEAARGDDLGREAVPANASTALGSSAFAAFAFSIRTARSGSSMQWPS